MSSHVMITKSSLFLTNLNWEAFSLQSNFQAVVIWLRNHSQYHTVNAFRGSSDAIECPNAYKSRCFKQESIPVRMRTDQFPTVHTSVATRCHYNLRVPQVNRFDHVSNDGQQISLGTRGGLGPGLGGPMSDVGRGLYSVQCIMGNVHMGLLSLWTEWQTDTGENITFKQLRLRTVIYRLISIMFSFKTQARVKIWLVNLLGQFSSECSGYMLTDKNGAYEVGIYRNLLLSI